MKTSIILRPFKSETMKKLIKLSFLSLGFLLSLGCKKKGDIQYLEDSGDWKIEKMEIRTTNSDGSLNVEKRTDFEFFRMYKIEKYPLFGAFVGTYTGHFFEIETYVDSTINTPTYTWKQTYCIGNHKYMELATDYVAPSGKVDPSRTYIEEASILSFNNDNQTWYISLFSPVYRVSFRKIKKNKIRVIITEQSPGNREVFIEIAKV